MSVVFHSWQHFYTTNFDVICFCLMGNTSISTVTTDLHTVPNIKTYVDF